MFTFNNPAWNEEVLMSVPIFIGTPVSCWQYGIKYKFKVMTFFPFFRRIIKILMFRFMVRFLLAFWSWIRSCYSHPAGDQGS